MNPQTKPRDAEMAPPLPHNADAERAVLGAILLDNRAYEVIADKITAQDFFLDQHRRIFERITQLVDFYQPVDLITLSELLSRHNELEAAGGPAYLSQLMDGMPRATNVEHHARIVKEKAALRQVIRLADAIRQEAFDGEVDSRKLTELATLRTVDTKRTIAWEGLETETDIVRQQGSMLRYIVDEIVPEQRITLLFGSEKAGKSIIALDLLKHVANGKPWLNRKTTKTPCLYLDFEDGVLGAYIAWLSGVGDEKVRFVTVRSENGLPAIDDPGLLAICREKRPLIVLDSLHKIFGRNRTGGVGSAWQSSDFEPVLERIRQLCVAGATVILIHHSTKSDGEQYRDSSAIGANVDFLFAVVGDEPDALGVKRIHLKGQPSRGAQPPTLHILAFPHIIEHGHLCLDAGLEVEDDSARRAWNVVAKHGPAKNKSDLAKQMKLRTKTALAGIASALRQGWLIESELGEVNLGQAPGNVREAIREAAKPELMGNNSGSAQENYPD